MIEIGNALVSLDVVETFFSCDLEKCKGQCCIEGDAGAPVTDIEADKLQHSWEVAKESLSKKAIRKIKTDGVAYVDSEGDLVTTIIDGKDCVFTCHSNGVCLCALEKVYREGFTDNLKPMSCSLYPIRLTEYPSFTALNYHKWDICAPALEKGKQKGIRMYQFLKDPLIRMFGQEWYDELCLTAEVYLEEKSKKNQT